MHSLTLRERVATARSEGLEPQVNPKRACRPPEEMPKEAAKGGRSESAEDTTQQAPKAQKTATALLGKCSRFRLVTGP
ncbi:hypothetical protein GCM10027161_25570 [Microbispora hainanensis]